MSPGEQGRDGAEVGVNDWHEGFSVRQGGALWAAGGLSPPAQCEGRGSEGGGALLGSRELVCL